MEDYKLHVSELRANLISGDAYKTLSDDNILGIVSYIPQDSIPQHSSIPHLQVRIHDENDVIQSEVWYGKGPVTCGRKYDIDFSHDGERMFGAVTFKVDTDLCHSDRTEEVFRGIFRLIREQGYENLFRMWSYIPGLNQDNCENVEIYKDFCYGRSAAFSAEFIESMGDVVPSATGIGSSAQWVSVYFLSQKNSDQIHIENPMQVPAYHYPPKYGVKAPSFSRATYVANESGTYQFYLSGTASVVGHSSHHETDVEKQTETTLLNIQRLIDERNLSHHGISHEISLENLDTIKVYIRNREDFPVVKQICAAFFRSDVSIIYLHADICRNDLLIELEGIFTGKIEEEKCF